MGLIAFQDLPKIVKMFADYQKLVDNWMEKFTSDSMALCETHPIREIPINSDK